MKDTILVTPRSLSAGFNPILKKIEDAGYALVFPSPGKQPSLDEIKNAIGDAVGYLAGVEPITAEVLKNAQKLRVISRNGTGVDNIDIETAARMNIAVRKAEGANARGVAELTMGLIFSAVRSIASSDRKLKSEIWVRDQSFELEGKTLGLIGCGKIGKMVSLFALAFGMRVLAYDAFPDPNFHPPGHFEFATLERVAGASDILSFHCPPLPDKKPILGPALLETTKRGLIVVNTARQSLVDEAAMLRALDAGSVRCYALDAFDKEPPEDYSLAKHERVIVTPHLGGFTQESVQRAAEAAIDNLLDTLRGA